MPTEKYLTTKHLKVKESKKVPTEVLTGTTILYGEDSSKIFTFPNTASPYTVTLPSADVGRTVKFIYNATSNANLSANVTIATKKSDEYIAGGLVTLNTYTSYADAQNQVLFKNGTSNNTVVVVGGVSNNNTVANAPSGTYLDFVCTTKGLWTVTGLGYVNISGGSNVFA